jgi:hypothetical protein
VAFKPFRIEPLGIASAVPRSSTASNGSDAGMHHRLRIGDPMMHRMRTTVTLDPDTEQIVRHRMRERGMTLKEALNDAIRSGVRQPAQEFRTQTASMGRSAVNLDRALQIVADLEGDELVRKMRAGS